MQLTRVLREGFIAGLIGAAAVALWFLVVDVIAGRVWSSIDTEVPLRR